MDSECPTTPSVCPHPSLGLLVVEVGSGLALRRHALPCHGTSSSSLSEMTTLGLEKHGASQVMHVVGLELGLMVGNVARKYSTLIMNECTSYYHRALLNTHPSYSVYFLVQQSSVE